jgi:hypothetical protein
VLLTAQAAHDADIVSKIEKHVHAGNSVVVTSGLLKRLQDRGLQNIAEIEDTGRVALVKTFEVGWSTTEGEKAILIPQIGYRTNDSWELVSALDGDNGWPLLQDAGYAKGHLYVLTIPENFADLYFLPEPALNAIRRVIAAHLPVRLEAPSKVSLFTYDNGTFIVENFRDEPVDVAVLLGPDARAIADVQTQESIAVTERPRAGWGRALAPDHVAGFSLPPHSFRAFRTVTE